MALALARLVVAFVRLVMVVVVVVVLVVLRRGRWGRGLAVAPQGSVFSVSLRLTVSLRETESNKSRKDLPRCTGF